MLKSKEKEMQSFKLAKVPFRDLFDGNRMPALGLGTLNIEDNELSMAIKGAIERGFRMIDTSPISEKEKLIGSIFREIFDAGTVKREDLFIVSKLWITDRNNVKEALRQSLKNL